jgi:TATA-box binding protein (TBP) (component of TFIID and TFIIIB)
MMRIVNRVFRGVLEDEEVFKNFEHNKVRLPPMTKIKLDFGTLLIFKGGKYRLMGKCENAEKQLASVEKQLASVGIKSRTCILQTMVVVHDIGARPTFPKNAMYEPELFPSALVKTPRGKANMFKSGKVVFLGVKCILDCYAILHSINGADD